MANLVFDFLHSYETGERRASDPADAYQYDEGHVLEAVVPVAVTSCEIQYWIRGMEKADAYTPTSITHNTDNTYTILGNIPNSYFETNGDLRVYIVVTDGDASITTYEGYIHIKERQMPEDYVDDDPENEATRVLIEAQTAAATATAAAETCEEVLKSIPEDYSQLSEDVDTLKDGLNSLTLDIDGEDGLLYLYVNGVKQGEGIEIGGGGTRYTITYNLAEHIVSSNNARKIAENESYTTTISTSDPNYTVDVITVTMGGADITSTAVSENVITIASVTANVAITVTVIEPVVLTSIDAIYTQSGTVYDVDSLDSLRSDLVVTANYSDSTSETVTEYALSGTLADGTSVVTVSYGGKTTSFNVTVTGIEWYEAQKSDVIGWSYPTYNGTQYAGSNGLNTTEPNIKFVSTMNGTRPVLWNNMPTTAERIKYDEGALVGDFDNKGTSSANSALRLILFSESAIAMLRKLTITYAPNFAGLDADLSDASNMTSVTMTNNTSMTALPIIPSSVTGISFRENTALVDLSGWETPSSVTNMRTVFQGCSSLVKAPIINAPNCTTFNLAFSGCNAVKEITIEDIDTNLLYGGSNVALLVTSGGLAGTAYFMIKCAPNNAAFPVIREQLASSNRTYGEMTYSMTGRTANTVNRICMYGDSLTKYNSDTGTYGTMPAQLLGMMSDDVVVQNFGYAGQTASSYKSYFDARTDLQADISVVWFGTNNIGKTGADIASEIQTNIIDGLKSDKYIVIGLLQGNYTADRNTAMASAFGNHYLDIHAYTLANWETITGLTPTSDDETAVANGNIPPSLLQSDSVHLNTYSGLVVATAIKEKLLSLGYIDSTWLAS